MARKQADPLSMYVAQKPEETSLASRIGAKLLEKAAQGFAEIAPYARGGLIDLQNFFAQAFPDSRQPATVLGQAGVPTPGEVDRERGEEQGREM